MPTFNPDVNSLYVEEEGLPVLLPESGQLPVLRVLDTAQLQGQLHVVGVQVVPVLHAPGHAVPLGPVGDPLGEPLTTGLERKRCIYSI